MSIKSILEAPVKLKYDMKAGQKQPAQKALLKARKELVNFIPVGYKIRVSGSAVNIPQIPWISILNPELTTTTQAGLYLVYLGIDAIRKRKVHAADMTNQGPVEPRVFQSIRDGFMVGVLNPKGLVFYAAVLPQFIDRDHGNITGQLLFLGALFSVLAFFSDGSWGVLAGTARAWLAGDASRLEKLRATGGCVMILLGASVILSTAIGLL